MLQNRISTQLLLIFFFLPISIVCADDNPSKALGQVQLSSYVSTNKDERGLFTTDFIVPLHYSFDKNTLLFYNPKNTYSTPEAEEFHQGFGLRHIFNDSYILGINAFFDRRQAHSSAWYSQAGVGLEYLSHPLDMRLNWYKPTTKAKTVDTTYGFGSTSLIQYDHREEPLQGLDVEAGVPVFDRYTKSRLYLGAYFYQSRLSKDINGFRVRTETSVTKWLSLDTTFNSNINKRNEFYGGLRVNLIFDLANLFNKTGKPVFSSPSIIDSKNTDIQDRLFDRVVRDIDIQSTTKITQSAGQDLVYVNNTNTGSQNGTLEHPYSTIPAGLTAAASGGKWVYVEGQGAAQYASDITLTNGITLWGSAFNGGFKGLPISGVYPVLNGGTHGITLDNNNTVMGLQIQNASSYGVQFTNGTTLTGNINHNNIISNGDDGIYLGLNTGAMNHFTISYNTLSNNSNNGINLAFNGFGGVGSMNNFIISNNRTINNANDGIDLAYNGGSGNGTMKNFTITNNLSNNNINDGIELSLNGNNGTGMMSGFTIANNITNNNANDGIGLSNNANGGSGIMTNFNINNNVANGNTNDGIDLSYNAHNNTGSMTDFTITNNTTNYSGHDGIDLSYNGDDGVGNGTMNGFTIANNTSNNNANDGIDFSYNGYLGGLGTINNLTISNNIFNSNGHDGINMTYNGNQGTGVISNVTLSKNIVNSNTFDGLELSHNGDNGNGTMTGFVISNNTFNSNYIGLDLRYNGISGSGTITDFTLTRNVFDSNQFDGVVLSFNYDTISNWTFLRNSVIANQYFGIIFSRDVGGIYNNINLGNGTSGGYNSLYGNGTGDLSTQVGFINLPAEYNWWGQRGGPVNGQVNADGGDPVDTSNFLRINPN